MAREIPRAQAVHTTKYDNFRGVDFTNDATNIWRRRSPTGVNMLPDASGRPFKRHGWDILLSNEEISAYLEVTSCTILKCSYFELAGVDHIVIFTDAGVVFYNGDFTAKNNDYDCYSGYDRCFFFEGDGVSAFYIYGNYKVWRYDQSFTLNDVTEELTIPRLLVGTSADGAGTLLESYNLLGTKASIEYNGCELYTYWGSDGLVFTVPDTFKASITINTNIYRYTWNGATWVDTNLTGVSFASTGIEVHSVPKEDDEIIVLYIYGVMLPNNVSDYREVNVNVTQTTQFDYPLTVGVTAPTDKTECCLYTDDTLNRDKGRAWIQFYDGSWFGVDGEDFIKVVFPTVEINIKDFNDPDVDTDLVDNGQASLIVEVEE